MHYSQNINNYTSTRLLRLSETSVFKLDSNYMIITYPSYQAEFGTQKHLYGDITIGILSRQVLLQMGTTVTQYPYTAVIRYNNDTIEMRVMKNFSSYKDVDKTIQSMLTRQR